MKEYFVWFGYNAGRYGNIYEYSICVTAKNKNEALLNAIDLFDDMDIETIAKCKLELNREYIIHDERYVRAIGISKACDRTKIERV